MSLHPFEAYEDYEDDETIVPIQPRENVGNVRVAEPLQDAANERKGA